MSLLKIFFIKLIYDSKINVSLEIMYCKIKHQNLQQNILALKFQPYSAAAEKYGLKLFLLLIYFFLYYRENSRDSGRVSKSN